MSQGRVRTIPHVVVLWLDDFSSLVYSSSSSSFLLVPLLAPLQLLGPDSASGRVCLLEVLLALV